MERKYLLERVDDAAIVQLYADGFDTLDLRDRVLVWHLAEAAIAGRDIYWDQRHRLNLEIRDLLEALLTHAEGLRPAVVDEIRRYTKLVWINTGPYNNLTARKFVLKLSIDALRDAVLTAASHGAPLPLAPGETPDALVDRLAPMLLDADVDPSVTCKNPLDGRDILEASASNLYAGVTMAALEAFDERYPLNSRLVRRDGALVEEVYRVGGRYHAEIAQVVSHLEAAAAVAPPATREALETLVRFYRTGEEEDREAYDIAWVRDAGARVDTINGFVEVYMDPRGHKGSWEALVWYTNGEKTARLEAIAAAAQWFEDRMPYAPQFRRPSVSGVSARAIDVVVETGDAGPTTAIGINLPNDERIRETYGSKSVSLANIVEAYDRSTPPAYRREFAWTDEEAERAERWSTFANELSTALHEIVGHGSGRLAPHVEGRVQSMLKEYYSALEETRADLVALYFIADPHLVTLGLVEGADSGEMARAEYESYARNVLAQLRRVREGTTIEEDHMRNRQTIVHWLMANTDAVSRRVREGRTYLVVESVEAFREGAGRMLAEVQRIKSEGDYEAARALVETYGVHFDPALRDEIVRRVDALDLASYTGFVMPELEAVRDDSGAIVDVRIAYPLDLDAQMLRWSARAPRRVVA